MDKKVISRIKKCCPRMKLGYEKLSDITSFRIGGSAFVVHPNNIGDIVKVLSICDVSDINYYVLGRATNVLFSDAGYKGIIIVLDNLVTMNKTYDTLYLDSGVKLSDACDYALKNGLSGMEDLYGIPGSVGGAVYMNAGAFDTNMGDIVTNVIYYYDGKIRNIAGSDAKFGYRHSVFMELSGAIILRVECKLEKESVDDIAVKMTKILNHRITYQPLDMPSAGSVFKKHEDTPMSLIIDRLGLKGYRIGDAMISTKHAGFIVNCGHASCQDVLELIKYIIDFVQDRCGFTPECEIIYVGEE